MTPGLHPLVWKWFHALDTAGALQWQGQILAYAADGVLVQLYEYLGGGPTVQRWVPLADVRRWHLYADAAAMRAAYDRFHGPRPNLPAIASRLAAAESEQELIDALNTTSTHLAPAAVLEARRRALSFDPDCGCGHPRSEHDYTGDVYDRIWGQCEALECVCRKYEADV